MKKINHQLTPAQKRKLRVRRKLFGTAERPRVTVFRSNKHLYLQAIDDSTGKTLASAHDVTAKKSGTKTESAVETAKSLHSALQSQKINAVIFDRGQYKYHGRVKAVAETLRSLGLEV